MPSLRNLLAIALATLVMLLVAPAARADERKPAEARKSDSADRSAGLRIAEAARDSGAAFSRDKDKCDDDKDKARGGVRMNGKHGKHKRPDCDDDDDDDDCDGGHGHHHGHDHKKPKDCHPSPKK